MSAIKHIRKLSEKRSWRCGIEYGIALVGAGALAGALLTSGASAAPGPMTATAGCGQAPTLTSGTHTISSGGQNRTYILSIPSNYDNSHPYRLIFGQHWLNGTANDVATGGSDGAVWAFYGQKQLSNNSTIFVAPNGQQNGANCTQASGCGWPNPTGSDMALADALVKQIEDNFCVDTNRIFATGWSYGASMSYETACERPLGTTTDGMPGFIRAIAVYSAMQLSGSCKPSKPVAYYASHGTNDTVLCYDMSTNKGGACIGNGGVGLCQNYATVNGCTWMTPTKVTSGNHVCTNLTGCTTGYPVEFCSFNGPHTPDPSDGGGGSWEYQNAWNFLSQF